MAIDWSYRPPQGDVGGEFLNAYQVGKQVSDDRERKTALSAYVPAAMQGDRSAVAKVAAVDPRMGVDLSQMLDGIDEKQRAKSLEHLEWAASAAMRPDGSPIQTEQELAQLKTLALARGMPKEQVDAFTLQQVPALLQASEKAREWQMKAKQFGLNQRVAEANIRQSDASAMASRAQAARLSAAPTGGAQAVGPDGKPIKLTETQSKDLGFYQRGMAANAEMTPARLGAMTSMGNTASRGLPGVVANVLQSPESKQGVQAAKNFIAAILRKDTGAAVTPQEFDFYSEIFLPMFGDDDQTVRLKADARKQALSSIKNGLGAAQILADMGINAPSAPAGAQGQSDYSDVDAILGLQ